MPLPAQPPVRRNQNKAKQRVQSFNPVEISEPTKIQAESTDEDTEESFSESDSDQEVEPVQPDTELSSMSFEELMRLQNTVGKKALQKAMQRPPGKALTEGRLQASKSQPVEMSSKKPVPFLRKVLPVTKTMRRDPRFDDLSGEYKPEVFEKTYKFLDDIKKREREVVAKKLHKTREPELKGKLEQLLYRMDQQEQATHKKQKLREKELEYKKELRERARQGVKPFYLKKGDIRKMELAEKYQELKKKGKLEHFLNKKRKRNSNKDRRRLPKK
ncbi:ribosomal RNA processing protein 36 homolog [Hyperolius riggenbachi]|uniref:ribosomal RNA processing protein 36 homolog n=1 Tax=Hyperolius riggenbachi TaxID=752182 RepID=UPI0035A39BEE